MCLSVWGGPVLPGVALGGFLAPGEPLTKQSRFHRADALILTFLVNNHHDKNKVLGIILEENIAGYEPPPSCEPLKRSHH